MRAACGNLLFGAIERATESGGLRQFLDDAVVRILIQIPKELSGESQSITRQASKDCFCLFAK